MDQDQTTQNVKHNLGSKYSDKAIYSFIRATFEIFFLSISKFSLTLSSIYTRFQYIEEKKALGKHCGKKVKLLKMSNFTFFPQCFPCSPNRKISLKTTFQLSSAASLNLGLSENLVLANGLIYLAGLERTLYTK